MILTTFFNNAVIAHAIATADELGILDELAANGSLSSRVAPVTNVFDISSYTYLLELLQLAHIVEIDAVDATVSPGESFEEALRYKGFFTWLFSASGAVLSNAGRLIASPKVGNITLSRDLALASKATADFGRLHLDPHILGLAEWRDSKFVADLGCGDASRLIELAQKYPLCGIGVDMSPAAVLRASSNIVDSGMSRRLSVKESDVRKLHWTPEYDHVDVLLCCLMGHDLWPRDSCIQALRNLAKTFPNTRTLILCETVRSSFSEDIPAAIPTLGYEYLHRLMRQYIPATDEWLDVLSESGWPVLKSVTVDMPASTQIFVCSASATLDY